MGSFYTPTSRNSSYGGGRSTRSSSNTQTTSGTAPGALPVGRGNQLPWNRQPASSMALPQLPNLFGGGTNSQLPWNRQPQGMQQGFPGMGAQPATPYNYAAPPMTSQAQRDPYLMQIFQANEAYRNQLAQNTDQDAILAQQRQRDVSSGIMNELTENAAQRGIGPESGASQWMQMRGADTARREQAGLNATMASQGRNMQMGALGQSGQLAGAAAGNLLSQQNYALDQWRAQQQAAQSQAQLQLAAQNSAYNNMAQMAQLQMQALNAMSNFYSGF